MNRPGNMMLLSAMMAILTLGMGTVTAAEEWKAPADAAQVKNPVPTSKESIAHGKRLYMRYCMNCHGVSGKGDGPEAAGLTPPPGNFTDSQKMNTETDGSLFWKITQGKGKMKPYAEVSSTHTDQEKWDLVNYIRTFAGGKKETSRVEQGKGRASASVARNALIVNYLNIARALSENDLPGALENAEILGLLADREIFRDRPSVERKIRESANQLMMAGDLIAARQAFAVLSQNLSDWLTASQYQYKADLMIYRCPDGPKAEPAIWIQKTGSVMNPYQVKDTKRSSILRKIEMEIPKRNP